MKKLVALGALIAVAAPVRAATQTVTLSVPDMNCAACPITVKKALTKVADLAYVKSRPALVRSFFRAPSVAYTTD